MRYRRMTSRGVRALLLALSGALLTCASPRRDDPGPPAPEAAPAGATSASSATTNAAEETARLDPSVEARIEASVQWLLQQLQREVRGEVSRAEIAAGREEAP
ncbi:MAG: hypothetical protein AB1486_15240 [Planctomycetota bacterium]